LSPVYILESIRTPRGKAKNSGGLHELSPYELLDSLYKYILTNEYLDFDKIDDVILGCVTQQGEQAGNIAKSSALYSDLPNKVNGLTLNRFCSSSLDAINFGYLKILSGQSNIIFAGGIEMMSRVPMLSDKASIWIDPKIALKSKIFMMGSGADLIASLNNISREEADCQAYNSQQKAHFAKTNNYFKSIIPVKNKFKDLICNEDECIRPNTTIKDLSLLDPSFDDLGKNGVDELQLKLFPELRQINHIHTAGNSPAMADAASITILSNSKYLDSKKYKYRASIKAIATVNDDPVFVLSGCLAATQRILSDMKLTVNDVDLFEIHEAFASTIIHTQKVLDIPDNKLNVNGGCIALGHPMGATGSIMMSTLLDEMERQDLSLGIVSTSGAAGAGTAILIER
jgi:acetyl-CoA C-acetyltransferase